MLGQVLKVIRLLGLSRAVRMKKHHDEGLRYVRGYAATSCWWALLNEGFLDRVAAEGAVDVGTYATQKELTQDVFAAAVEYLVGIGLLERHGPSVAMSKSGKAIFAEPRGLFELLWAYEPCFANLPKLLTGEKVYGPDVSRDVTYVGIGSGRLCEQLPYPVMRRMILEHGCREVLDLGCGDMALLRGMCQMDREIRGVGIDLAEEMVAFNRKRLAKDDCGGRLDVMQADMFDLPNDLQAVDCITACDTFHEYLGQDERIVALLAKLKERFAGVLFVVGEFCLQDEAWLAKHKTASLEHHLFHQLSRQQIGTAAQWREIFARAGLELVEEQVYDLIGHGYFALR